MKKEIEIDYSEGEGIERIELKGKVTLKRLNFSEKNALDEESVDVRIHGSVPNVKVSTAKMKEIALLKGITQWDMIKTTYVEDRVTKKPIPISAAYPPGITGIRELPMELGESLFEEFTALNTLSQKKNSSSATLSTE